MKTSQFPRVRNFLRLWSEVAQGMFPFMREEFGELDPDQPTPPSRLEWQVMIPLVKKASERMEHGFDLANAAYDAEAKG